MMGSVRLKVEQEGSNMDDRKAGETGGNAALREAIPEHPLYDGGGGGLTRMGSPKVDVP